MRILMTSVVDLQKSQHNRPHHFVKELYKDHDLTVVSINDWWKLRHGNPSYDREFGRILPHIDYQYLTERRISPIIQELACGKPIKNLMRRRFDLHLNFNTLVSGRIVPKNIPTIFDMADDLVAMAGSSPQIPSKLRLIAWRMAGNLVKGNIQTADRVTITVDSLRREYEIPPERAELLPNGVDTSIFSPANQGKFTENALVLGYVGVLREWVDLRPVFEALKHLKEAVFVIVGREGALEYNRELARAFGVSDRVSFLGGVPYSEIPRHISGMDVCLIPFAECPVSKHSLPLKLFEYLSCEKPVISTPLQGVMRIAGDRVLYASSSGEYVNAVRVLVDDPVLCRRLGKRGRRFVRQKYDWSIFSKKLKSIISDLAP